MKNIGIGIIGLGNIGSRLYKEIISNKKDIGLKTNTNINIVAISAKNINKKRSFSFRKKIFFKNPLKIVENPNVNIVIELIGKSDGISKRIIETALKNKKHVITANKALISKHGDSLTTIAEKNKVNLEFEAAVGGGIPVLRTIKEGLATNKISKVYGILNGTCNYILSEMESSKDSFIKVLKKAQKLGYAEPTNPKLDLNGYDAMAKIRILSSLAFNKKISKSKSLMEGIEDIETKDIDIANQLNLRIKLLGITETHKNKIGSFVYPCLVEKKSLISNVDGVYNGIVVESDFCKKSFFQGEGAGSFPTATSVLSDIITILKSGSASFTLKLPKDNTDFAKIEERFGSYYLRFTTLDKPGVVSGISNQFKKCDISMKSMLQKDPLKDDINQATIVVTTHNCKEKNMITALNKIDKLDFILKKTVYLRIESFK